MRTPRKDRTRSRQVLIRRRHRTQPKLHDPSCLIALHQPEHECVGDGACEVWARVREARRLQAARPDARDHYQEPAEEATLHLLLATYDLLEATARWTAHDPHLAARSSSATTALLNVDRLAAMAGWSSTPALPPGA